MKILILGAASAALLLSSCGTVDINAILAAIQKDAKQYCGVIVAGADLAVALSGQDPKTIAVSQVAHSICDQYLAKVQANAPGAPATPGCVEVKVNNKPVQVCK